MSEVDEQRIAEIAKEPPRILPGGAVAGTAGRGMARRTVELMALLRTRGRHSEDDRCQRQEG